MTTLTVMVGSCGTVAQFPEIEHCIAMLSLLFPFFFPLERSHRRLRSFALYKISGFVFSVGLFSRYLCTHLYLKDICTVQHCSSLSALRWRLVQEPQE
jgi:hypothetical protein